MINCKFKMNIHLKDGTLIKEGTNATVEFETDTLAVIRIDDRVIKVASSKLPYFLTKFKSEPSIKTMFNWSNTGIARTITGKKCEPDGYGNDGSPSWMLVLGVI